MGKQPYDKIYLIGWHPEATFYEDVTWCQDQIGENEECPDIEYIRADIVDKKDDQPTLAEERVAELEKLLGDFYEFFNHQEAFLDHYDVDAMKYAGLIDRAEKALTQKQE